MRPGVDIFLREMSELYEVVIFTAAMQDVIIRHLIDMLVCRLGVGSDR